MSGINDPRIIVALDFDDIQIMRELVSKLSPKLCRVKIGKTLFTRYGPACVQELTKLGFDVFLDLKFHDIPKQVAGAVKAAADLGVWMLTLHVHGGRRMMEAAVESLASMQNKPLLVGVTVLTSLAEQDLEELHMRTNIEQSVLDLAQLAQQSGLDGVVCSAQEAASLRETVNPQFLLVTPGIRLATDSADDQRRVVTPEQAFQDGADYLVMGRSIVRAQDPVRVLESVAEVHS